MNLSKNFTLEELCETSSHLPNIPTQGEINALGLLVREVLQPLRDKYGKSITVNSGFRSLAVNQEKGGASKPLSQHCKGEAADLSCEDNSKLFHLIKDNFVFDQMIWEGGNHIQPAWVHVSYKTQGNRGECLRMEKINGKSTYTRI